jgi:hypothetical protein
MRDRPIPLRPAPEELQRAERRSLVRGITALALSNGHRNVAADLLKRTWPNDGQAERIVKAAFPPTGTGDFPAATRTNPLLALAPQSASARLFERCLQVDLDGVASVRLPFVAGAPQPGFIGEMGVGPGYATELQRYRCRPGEEDPCPGRIERRA